MPDQPNAGMAGKPRLAATLSHPAGVEEAIAALKGLISAARSIGQHLVYNAPTKELSDAIDRASQAYASLTKGGEDGR